MTLEKMVKFCPAIRNALQKGFIDLDDATFDFEDITPVYRGVKMRKDENRPLKRSDFSSQIERFGPERQEAFKNDRGKYSCSCFMTKESLFRNYKSIVREPDRFRYAKGTIRKQNGAIMTGDTDHIHWFLYDGSAPESDFKVE